MTDPRPSWADKYGYTIHVPAGHVAIIVPFDEDDE